MESDILDGLDQVGYSGALEEEKALLAACEEGFTSEEYVELCVWLEAKLKQFSDVENKFNTTTEDAETRMRHFGELLQELACPYDGLVSGLMDGKLKNKKDHLKIILFLVSELQAAQIVASNSSFDKEAGKPTSPLQDLQMICKTLQLPEPGQQQISDLFTSIENQINILLKKVAEKHIGKPVLKESLNSEQWKKMEKINRVLLSDYECRRRMLIKRLDVTVQSFSWSERAKVKTDMMAKAYQPKRHSLTVKSSVSLAHLLAAREDICNVVKTSSGASREKTACAVNRVLMGRVPDRGGRPSEIQAPPPEMPPWQKRQDGGGRGGGGGYRGRGGGGGYGGGGGGGGYGGGGYGGGYGGGGYGGGGYGGGGSKGGWGQGGGGRDNWGKGGRGGYYR